jgi:hypothetical protein
MTTTTDATILLAEEQHSTRRFLYVIWGWQGAVVDVAESFRIGLIWAVICGASSVSPASVGSPRERGLGFALVAARLPLFGQRGRARKG